MEGTVGADPVKQKRNHGRKEGWEEQARLQKQKQYHGRPGAGRLGVPQSGET